LLLHALQYLSSGLAPSSLAITLLNVQDLQEPSVKINPVIVLHDHSASPTTRMCAQPFCS